MKKITSIVTVGATLLLALGSCNKRLDIDPIDTVAASKALQTSADVQSLLAGGYAAMGGVSLYGGGLQYSADLLGDPEGADSELFWQGTFVQPNQIYQKSILVNNSFVAGTWTSAYRAINIANTVLANLDKVAAVQRDAVEGGAKFIRGAMYFELVRFYARDWNDGDPTTNLGVPLILTATNVEDPTAALGDGAKVSRNTVAQVYTQVLADLNDAVDKLPAPTSATSTFYATTYSASGMLSRVYLQQNNYELAALQADAVIESGIYRLLTPITDEFASKTNTNEDIFAVQITVQSGTNDLDTYYSINGRGGDTFVQDGFVCSFDTNDARGKLFNYDAGVPLTTKFDDPYGDIHEMRLAEMYLTRAEANFRASTQTGAAPLDDINTVRARVGLDPLTDADLDLPTILLERHHELAFEGFYLHDLKRNKLPVGDIPYNSPRLVFPIPQRERDVNSNLVQNPGYM